MNTNMNIDPKRPIIVILIGLLLGILLAYMTSCASTDSGSVGKKWAKDNGYNTHTYNKHIKQFKL